jgi:PII-like signaling protein
MTNGEREAMVLSIYVSETEQWQGRPLHEAILEEARKQGLPGATVLRGVAGFGLRGGGGPLVVEIVDWEDRAESFLDTLREMVQEGLVTTQRVNVAHYTSRAG